MLSLYPSIGPYERVGRYFVVYLAQVNISLAKDDGDHLSYDNLSKMTLGISELPKELHDRMLSGFADYVVNNLLVLVRGKSLCSLWSALFSNGRFPFLLATQAIAFRVLVRQTALFVNAFLGPEVRP